MWCGSYFWRLYVASQVITKKGKLFSSEFARCFLGFTLPRSDRKRVWSNSGLMATSFQDPWRFVHSFDAPLWFHRKAGSNVCKSLLLFFFGGFFCKVQLLIEDAVATTTWIVTNYYHFDGDDEFDSYYIYILISIRHRILVFFHHDDLQQHEKVCFGYVVLLLLSCCIDQNQD